MTTFIFLHFVVPVAFFVIVAVLTHTQWAIDKLSETARQVIVVICILLVGALVTDFAEYRCKEIIEQLMKNRV